MSLSVQTNVTSLIAQDNLRVNSQFQSRTIERLTSGYRINASGDDAAGLSVANKFRSDVAELQQGVRNANDGLSQLQIIDGGINNISKSLDRLKTLATQSASTTFSGDRSTLDREYQQVLGEITRQASNIGLNSGGRFNANISVYTGGGNNATNAQVGIDLSGSASAVDAASLGLSTTNVLAGATGFASNTVRLDAPGDTFGGGSQTFTFNLYTSSGAQTITANVGAAGQSATQVLEGLNSQLSPYGISASLDSAGEIQFGGGTAFTVAYDSGTASAGNEVATDNQSASNGGNYTVAAGAYTADAETLTFQTNSGTKSVTLTASETLDSAIAKINAQTSSAGVFAVLDQAGTGISIQSSGSFSVQSDISADGVLAGGAYSTATGPTNTSTAVGNAKAAIAKIDQAVASLGLVQGKVGSGQNKLQSAIQLAQSQVANFSAAESRIRDADVATEAANLTKAQVLQQASIAALAQANSAPQAVLSLLRG